MTYRGTVKGGVVILEGAHHLPEGTEVTIAPVQEAQLSPPSGKKNGVRDQMLKFGKSAEVKPSALPADLAANHDHYLHGLSKR